MSSVVEVELERGGADASRRGMNAVDQVLPEGDRRFEKGQREQGRKTRLEGAILVTSTPPPDDKSACGEAESSLP